MQPVDEPSRKKLPPASMRAAQHAAHIHKAVDRA
jgi:hypothetical protein